MLLAIEIFVESRLLQGAVNSRGAHLCERTILFLPRLSVIYKYIRYILVSLSYQTKKTTKNKTGSMPYAHMSLLLLWPDRSLRLASPSQRRVHSPLTWLRVGDRAS